MPGIFTGMVQGIQANRQFGLEQQRVDIARQEADLAKQRLEHEQKRQDYTDQLNAANEALSDEYKSSATARGYVNTADALKPQGTRPTEATAAAAWDKQKAAYDEAVGSDDYKRFQEQIADSRSRIEDLNGRKQAALGGLGGVFAGDAHQDADIAKYNIASGNWDAVSPRQAHALVMKMSGGINPQLFAADKNGQMPADDVAAQLHEGLTTGQWDGKQDAITAVLPFINVAVGQKMPNGNTITGVQVTHLMYDKNDPKYLHYTLAGDHEDDNGANKGRFSTPHMSDDHKIPVDALKKGIQQFTNTYQLAKDPRFQQKLGESVANNDHALGDYMRVAARAGQFPAPAGHVVLKPGESVFKTDPNTGSVVGGPEASVAPRQTGRMAILQALVDQGIASDIGEANAMYDEQQKLGKFGPSDRSQLFISDGQAYAFDPQSKTFAPVKTPPGQPAPTNVSKPGTAKGADPEKEAKDIDDAAKAIQKARPKMSWSDARSLAKASRNAQPMPAKKEALTKGNVYQTARGLAQWDGSKFTKVPQ